MRHPFRRDDTPELAAHADLRLAARTTPTLLARLLIVGNALDVLGEAFLLTGLLEPPQQLLRGLVAATLDLDHVLLPAFSAVKRGLDEASDRAARRRPRTTQC